MNIKALALAIGLSALFGTAEAQTINSLSGVTIGTPGSGQSLQNFSYSCSVSGCATGTVVPLVAPAAANAALSATNGLYANLLQGNAVLSATHGLFTNLLQGDAVIASGNPLFITGTGTAGSAATGVQTVQGIASMTPLLVNPGTATSWGVLGQASTTSGELGGLSMGAVTTSSPTYTTAQTSPLSLDTTGALRVNVTAGGGSGGTSSSFGSAFPGTGSAAGAEYLTSAPTLTNGQMVAFQTDINGDLKIHLDACTSPVCNVNGSATSANSSPVVIASDQVAVAVKAASAAFASGSIASGALAAGSISSGAAVSGAYATGAIADLAVAQGATTSGKVGNMGLAAVTTAAPTYTTAQLDPLSLDTAGNLRTLDSQSGTWNITNISGTVSLPTGASTSALQPTNAAQGSTTSGQTGHLMEGAVTTAAPTYTTAQTSPLSIDTTGNLRVNCTGCSSSTSITTWAGGTLGAMANFGTTPGAVLVPGQNASLFIGTTAAAAGHGTAATALRVELPTDGTGVVGLNAGAALIGKVGIDQTTVGTTNAVSLAQIGATTISTGTGAVGTGTARIAVGTDTATIAGSAPSIVLNAAPQAITTGGGSLTGNIAANNTTAVVVKASAGTLYSLQLSGISSAPAYLKIYNATSATCGSGTPVGRYMIPAAATAANGAGSNIDLGPVGVAYGTGITYCVTTGITDADTTAPAASTFLVNLVWK